MYNVCFKQTKKRILPEFLRSVVWKMMFSIFLFCFFLPTKEQTMLKEFPLLNRTHTFYDFCVVFPINERLHVCHFLFVQSEYNLSVLFYTSFIKNFHRWTDWVEGQRNKMIKHTHTLQHVLFTFTFVRVAAIEV